MGAVRVLGVPVAWRLVRVPYSVGRTRALRCIAHVHVLVALDAAAPPLRSPWRWRLLDVAGWMLPHAIGSMVRHVCCIGIGAFAHQWHFPSCSVTRTHSICKRHVGAVVRPIASTLPVRHPQLCDISFKAKQHSTAEAQPQGLFGVPTATPPAHRAASKTPRPTSC